VLNSRLIWCNETHTRINIARPNSENVGKVIRIGRVGESGRVYSDFITSSVGKSGTVFLIVVGPFIMYCGDNEDVKFAKVFN